MKTNTPRTSAASALLTHEGARASHINPVEQLRRSVMCCMLWEDSFYVDGVTIAEQIHQNVEAVLALHKTVPAKGADIVTNIAVEAREKFKLRHAPLWLILALAKHKATSVRQAVPGALFAAIQRADELSEFLSLYWRDEKGAQKKTPIANQVKKGLALAFTKFSAYDLAKYSGKGSGVSLRDVLFLTHAKPKDDAQASIWKQLVDNTLPSPDTWEVALSAGGDKKEEFTRLLEEKKLGALALLRNLRNMQQAGVDESLIREGLTTMKTERVLPFRFITAARYAPKLEPELEKAMFRCLESQPKLAGKTVLVVDNSGSMHSPVSAKSELQRVEAACALAMLLREICHEVQVVVFGSTAGVVRPRRGFALRDEIVHSQHSGGTDTGRALLVAKNEGYDRCIVITDEQSHTQVSSPAPGKKGYFINVASYQNGVGYGAWVHMDGWSEACIDWIQQHEQMEAEAE